MNLGIKFALCALLCNVIISSADRPDAVDAKSHTKSLHNDFIQILYCTSCGFAKNYMEVKKHLENRYPQLRDRIYGDNYAVHPALQMLAQFLGYAQFGLMILIIFGDKIFRQFGWDETHIKKAMDNRIACFTVLILVGTISQKLISSGAFEIYLNDDLIFSKIESGRWPTIEELLAILDARITS
uniref:Uncharacterized protein AlNc14C32G2970 n=1 Tax=Albugo laibachii Nc14 TaxID=890382 RepID=F0W821_9STRA|nr:conserved hypothetical protein [Albugo laibachii Nc14]|eukprot:CCA17274.1 conserved hypothetical protein [Albugo laibachii Nc14]